MCWHITWNPGIWEVEPEGHGFKDILHYWRRPFLKQDKPMGRQIELLWYETLSPPPPPHPHPRSGSDLVNTSFVLLTLDFFHRHRKQSFTSLFIRLPHFD